MSDRSPDFRNLSSPHVDPMEDEAAWRVRAIFVIRVFLAVYTPFLVFQFYAYYTPVGEGLVDYDGAFASVMSSVVSLSVVALSYIAYGLIERFRPEKTISALYALMIIITSTITVAIVVHTHLTGTNNTVIMAAMLTVILVASWFIRFRHALLISIFGHLLMVGVILLEYSGVIRYAPLVKPAEMLKSLFLDWRAILMNLIVYGLTAVISVITISRYQKTTWERSERLRRANRELIEEIARRRQAEEEKARLIADLQTALAEVKTLSGLLPICAHCKKIRDDGGYWTQLEGYLSSHADISFTHSLCPDCAERLYPRLKDPPPHSASNPSDDPPSGKKT